MLDKYPEETQQTEIPMTETEVNDQSPQLDNHEMSNPILTGPLVLYQSPIGRPTPYSNLPVLILFKFLLLPGAADNLSQNLLNGQQQRSFAEEATATIVARSHMIPMVPSWLETCRVGPSCPFTGNSTIFTHMDRGTQPAHRMPGFFSPTRPSLYICLSAPATGSHFFTPGYPEAVIQIYPGDAVLCPSLGDEIFHLGPDGHEAVFMRLYGDFGPGSYLFPRPAGINPQNLSENVSLTLRQHASNVENPSISHSANDNTGLKTEREYAGDVHGEIVRGLEDSQFDDSSRMNRPNREIAEEAVWQGVVDDMHRVDEEDRDYSTGTPANLDDISHTVKPAIKKKPGPKGGQKGKGGKKGVKRKVAESHDYAPKEVNTLNGAAGPSKHVTKNAAPKKRLPK